MVIPLLVNQDLTPVLSTECLLTSGRINLFTTAAVAQLGLFAIKLRLNSASYDTLFRLV